jgi:hypothetical protein
VQEPSHRLSTSALFEDFLGRPLLCLTLSTQVSIGPLTRCSEQDYSDNPDPSAQTFPRSGHDRGSCVTK